MAQSPTTWTTTGLLSKPILVGDPHTVQRLAAKMFDKAYAQLTFPAGSSNKYCMPGLVVALNSVTNKYVPWVSDASHGAGSDTAVGILTEKITLTEWDRMIAPVYDAVVIEANVYTEESAIGVIAAGIKTDLGEIAWR